MSSIRPLVTITILVVVGVFLYTKINEGPARSAAEIGGAAADSSATGVPALATPGSSDGTASLTPAPWGGSSNADSNAAPQWAGGVSDTADSAPPTLDFPPAGTARATAGETAAADGVDDPSLPALPAIPELPSFAPTDNETDSAISSPAKSRIELPTSIPTARYPDEAGDTDAGVTQSVSPPNSSASMPTMSRGATDNMPTLGASAAHSMPTMSSPAPSSAARTDNADRYGPVLSEDSSDSFAAVWPEIQTALARQELAQAHEILSQWYGNPALSPAESQQVESLLSQLAGTVVYSTEHRLEPPYVVRAGDTLPMIAEKYHVPWQLLAKINGIPAADAVQPGQELKVIQGPFTAVVELDKQQLTLALAGRYAGRFPITVEPGADSREGQWVVEQKLANPSAGPVDHVLVLRGGSPLAAGETISITSGPATPSGPTAVAPPAVRLTAQDAEELADILSVGSRVVIRR
jgi:LysM repeat protein